MFLAGDYVGIAIHAIAGATVKLWNYIKTKGFIRIVFALVKGLLKLQVMIWKIPLVLGESLIRAGASLAKWIFTLGKFGSLGEIG